MIQQHPMSVSASEEDFVTMSCAFGGVQAPATTIHWLKDDKPTLPNSVLTVQVRQRRATYLLQPAFYNWKKKTPAEIRWRA